MAFAGYVRPASSGHSAGAAILPTARSKAVTATAHKLARIFYTVLRYGVEYQERSEEEFVAEHRKRMEKNRHRRARELRVRADSWSG
jgi:hypothetical protein